MKQFSFEICARVGQPGFADDDEYISQKFNSIKEVLFAYWSFNPNKHFKCLRNIGNERIIVHDKNNEIEVRIVEGMMPEGEWQKLTPNEDEIDKIIAEYQRG
jgi:hypothetical protein